MQLVCVSVCILQVYKQMRKLFASRLIIRCLHPEICNISLRHRQRGGAEGRHVGMLACRRVGDILIKSWLPSPSSSFTRQHITPCERDGRARGLVSVGARFYDICLRRLCSDNTTYA